MVESLFTLLVDADRRHTANLSDGVQLVDEDDAGRFPFRLREQVAQAYYRRSRGEETLPAGAFGAGLGLGVGALIHKTALAERIRARIPQHSTRRPLSVSVGVATLDPNTDRETFDSATLMRAADAAIYEAKWQKSGRRRVARQEQRRP